MTYYLKYRPQLIDDLDIASVRESLLNISKSKSIPHAFLFSGPKGTGKTSAARILAKIINCKTLESKSQNLVEPCNKCDSCIAIANGTNIDVIEMDAASNRGIDDIRLLRDMVKLSPANSRAKVYIVDEAHMLTTEASNALLKTLEEPPSHVYFILATTNPEKLIDTIKSRTTVVNFSKATTEETKRSLRRIVASEKIKITNENVDKIIKKAKGSFRDAVKILEQYSNDETVLNTDSTFDAVDFVQLLMTKDDKKIIEKLKKVLASGVSVQVVVEETLEVLEKQLVEESDSKVIPLIEFILSAQEYNKVSPIEELPLEVALIKWCII